VPWPFYDLTGAKRRPALVLRAIRAGQQLDYLICMVTTKQSSSSLCLELEPADIAEGVLTQKSFVRPLYLSTLDSSQIIKVIGKVSEEFRLNLLAQLKQALDQPE
jgi:mRNA interferase MazF